MSLDELIRVLASTRTDLNKAKMILKAAPGEIDSKVLEEVGAAIEDSQDHALRYVRAAVERVNDMINTLNDVAKKA